MFTRFIHVVTGSSTSFLLVVKYSVAWVYTMFYLSVHRLMDIDSSHLLRHLFVDFLMMAILTSVP